MFPTCLQWVAWPSGLRRWIKAPVSSGAWVRIPPLPSVYFTSANKGSELHLNDRESYPLKMRILWPPLLFPSTRGSSHVFCAFCLPGWGQGAARACAVFDSMRASSFPSGVSSRQEYWSGLPCLSPGGLPNPGIKPAPLTVSCTGRQVLYHECHLSSQGELCRNRGLEPRQQSPRWGAEL